MSQNDLTMTLSLTKPASAVFDAINDVKAWWCNEFEGSSTNPGDEFDVRFGNVHYSRQRVIEMIPNKEIVWLVTASELSFLEDKTEWNNTRIEFDIVEGNNKTEIHFTHHGLTPALQCFKDCTNGWNQFLLHSLVDLIETGKGDPDILNAEVREKTFS